MPAGVRVTGPTFDVVHELPGRIPIVPVDLYRLEDPGELRKLGITDRGAEGAVLLIERIEDRQHEHPPTAITAVLGPIHVTLRTGLRHRPRPESPIDDEVFDSRVVLLEDALDRRADESALVVRRRDDGDEGEHEGSVSGAVVGHQREARNGEASWTLMYTVAEFSTP